MEALYLLVPLSIVIVFLAVWVFFQASDSGQFDDLVGPGLRILHDDDTAATPDSTSPETTTPDSGASDAVVPKAGARVTETSSASTRSPG